MFIERKKEILYLQIRCDSGRNIHYQNKNKGVEEMEKQKRMKPMVFFLLLPIVALLACLAILGVWIGNYYNAQAKAEAAPTYRTFADWTEREELQEVPALVVEGTRIEEAQDYGDGTYGIIVVGTTLSDYQEYLTLVEMAGFEKVVDNGETGLVETIYTSSYKRDNLALTVTQVVSTEKTYIMACKDLEFSKHLFYDKSYVADNEAGRKTKVHNLELWDSGNSFIFELKNGHFIINDGGQTIEDLKHLLDYLEALVPAGEKPVIEAWIFSHTHTDHIGAFMELANHVEYTSRIIVNGIYWNVPNYEVYVAYDSYGYSYLSTAKIIAKMLRTTEGDSPKIYHLQSGQRYYFNDITMDVLHTQEQIIRENYYGNLNDASVWLMYNIDGDNFLLAGDAERGSTDVVMNTFASEYFDLKVFTVFHHAINMWNDFTDYLSYDVALYPNYRVASKDGNDKGIAANLAKYINDNAKEGFAWGKGTAVLTFPYELGTGEFKPGLDWSKYATGERTGTKIWVEEFDVYFKNY